MTDAIKTISSNVYELPARTSTWGCVATCREEPKPEPAKPRDAVAPSDEAKRAFTVQVMELYRGTAKRSPERFSATALPVEVLARLGHFLTDIANLKKSEAEDARCPRKRPPAEVSR
jgi:hypothetical protein